MGERLTKEREAEIRRVVDKMSFCPTPSLVRDLLAEIDALRAAPPTTYLHADGTEEPIGELVARLTRERDEALASAEMWSDNAKASTIDLSRAMTRAEKAEARVRELLDAHAKLLDRLETAKARVRELEAERDAEHASWLDAYGRAERHEEHINEIHASFGCEREWSNLHDCGACAAASAASVAHELADLAETRAKLARLREAALMLVDRIRAEGGHGHRVHELSGRVLDALSTPGPTLDEIRRAAQVEVLRKLLAELDTDDSEPLQSKWGEGRDDGWKGAMDSIRKRADDLEAGRE